MNLYELMSGNLQTAQSSQLFPFGTQPDRSASESRSASSFSAILDTKLNSAERQTAASYGRNTASVNKQPGPDGAKTENKPKYLTFREANANVGKTAESDTNAKTAKTVGESEKTDEDGAEDRKRNVRTDTQENFLNICAQLLGVDKDELQKLLDKAGVSVDSLKDAAGVKQAAADLSQLLGLNGEQAGALKELFAVAAETLGLIKAGQTNGADDAAGLKTVSETPADASKATDVRNISDAAAKAKPESTTSEEFLDRLASEIGSKLDEISVKARMDNSTVEDELKDLMRPLLEKAEITAKAVRQETQEADAEIGPADSDDAAQTQAAVSSEKDSAKADDKGGSDTDAKSAQKAVVSQPVQTVKTDSVQVQYQTVQDVKQANPAAAEKTPATLVKPGDLINQVVEKAKVVLSPDKSEMVIDLKPDSLGKLSLKVVTENGIVMAKFVADSQQVREILESNMQLLKDSLEKQGMNVQGFSVSVRQDQRGSDTNRQQYGISGNTAARTVRNVSGLQGQLSGVIEAGTARNPYQWEDSTINLTA